MIFLNHLATSEESMQLVQHAQSLLYQAGYFSAAYELALLRSGNALSASTEQAAIQKGYIDGYLSAITDLMTFHEKFGKREEVSSNNVVPDYGALDSLYATKQISREEYEQLRRKQQERFNAQ